MNAKKNRYMLKCGQKRNGYDWWWHSFTAYNKKNGEPRTFFIEYFVINPAISPQAIVFGQKKARSHADVKTLTKPCYVMIKAGSWGKNGKQIHAFYPTEKLIVKNRNFKLSAGCCSLSETYIEGAIAMPEKEAAAHPEYMSDSGSMAWKLKVNKRIPFDVGYCTSWLFRRFNLFQMYWHAQGVKTDYTGSVVFDGQEYIVPPEKSYGYADKNWGTDFTSPWVWLSSCNLVSQISGNRLENACFDIGGGCPKICKIPLNRKLLAFFHFEGKNYVFNFSHFWKKSKVDFSFSEEGDLLHWFVSAENRSYLFDVDVYCKMTDSIFINYESPSGEKNFDKLWNCGNGFGELKFFRKKHKALELVEDTKIYNCGCEYGEYKKTAQ
ncbi:MAG: hypothetical protein K5930_12775 [Treponemataceae bacterium]|nr:hypothetical protein [Treponemataceae bacterium]